MIQIIGKGGFAREVKCYIRNFAPLKEVIMGEFEEIDSFDPDEYTVIAIGDPGIKKVIFEKYKNLFYNKLLFGLSYGDLNVLGKGSIVCPGTILTTNVKIGDHVILNLNCTVGHDAIIGDYTTVSPGVNISGNVKIGKLCYIGTNAVIREKIQICDNVVIGAGAVVVKDITEPGIYAGNPCKKIK